MFDLLYGRNTDAFSSYTSDSIMTRDFTSSRAGWLSPMRIVVKFV